MIERLAVWFYGIAFTFHLLRLDYETETREVGDDGQVTVVLLAEPKWFWQR